MRIVFRTIVEAQAFKSTMKLLYKSPSVQKAAVFSPSSPPVFVCLLFCIPITGCSLTPLAKHTVAFSQASDIVVTHSKDAYRAANRLRQREQIAAAVYAYGKDPHWSPYNDIRPLLTSDQLDARIKVLDGLKSYADSLVQLTVKQSNSDSDALNTAAAGVGSNLKTLSQTVSTDLGTALPGVSALTTSQVNVISTAVLGLGEYLQRRKVKGALPEITKDMNPQVQILCNLLQADVKVLRRQADVDYTNLVETQNQFIQKEGSSLSPIQKRDEIGKLVGIATEQKANDDLLQKLQDAIAKLAETHGALAVAAQNDDSEALSQKIAELAAAGQELGNFYRSLPSE